MRFSPDDKEGSTGNNSLHSGRQSILRVPSLASAPGTDHREGSNEALAPQIYPDWQRTRNVFGYRPDAAQREAWSYYTAQPPQFINSPATSSTREMPPYYPVRGVRSGRGACRLPLNRNLLLQKLSSQDTAVSFDGQILRPSFPVSNRGRGGPLSRCLSLPTAVERIPSSSSESKLMRPFIKRKLAMTSSRKNSASDTDESTEGIAAPKRVKKELTTTLSSSFVSQAAAV
jgi:hypothetical protein